MTDDRNASHALHPRPFEDGHALTYTVREVYEAAGEFKSQHHYPEAAAYAFALAQQHANFAELRNTAGEVIADYVRGQKVRWYVEGSAP
jgi:hypothetical protein